jgi:transposase-like protein
MSGRGRPTLYKPEHASRARELCARGATTPDLAGRFGVARSTIGQWIATHPEFAEAVQQGRDIADATAVESLFTRVTGYNHQEKVFLHRGEPKTVTCTAHVPPETRACMFWLRNRRPEDWRAKAEAALEIVDDIAAALDAAGERMRHAGK